MILHRVRNAGTGRTARVAAAVALIGFGLLLLGFGQHDAAGKTVTHATSAACPPEANSCVQMPFPCAGSCSVTAGPVTNIGQNQAVYVDVTGVPAGDTIGLAFCSLSQGDQVVAQPQCASILPPASPCNQPPCNPTSSPLEWQFGTVTGNDTVLSIGTEFDPAIPNAQPIVSQTSAQYDAGVFGSFFCDNGPANPCGVEVVDITQQGQIVADGYPPRSSYPLGPANTVVIPVSFAQTGNGCGSAPTLEADASYSAAQFLPAAGSATCTGPNGVAILPTDEASTDDKACASGGGVTCPVADVINGTVPVSFTDDPEDPATLAEEQTAGGKFAYIPIAVSATEIGFVGAAAGRGTSQLYPLQNYDLTPAQTAGILTQLWNSPGAVLGAPNDDLCGQLSGKAQCAEKLNTATRTLQVQTINGQYANIVVSGAFGGTAENLPFTTFDYFGSDENFSNQNTFGTQRDYADDTGYGLLNPWPQPQVNVEQNLAAMFPSTGSGSMFETTGWMCDAPAVPYTVKLPWGGQASVNDLMSSKQVLTDVEQGPLPIVKDPTTGQNVTSSVVNQYILAKPSKCQGLSKLPTDFASTAAGVVNLYDPSSSPLTAAHAVQSAVSKFTGIGGFAFTAIDSSEADFFGLLPASLQNAAGSFVQPTPSSITAALGDTKTNADGTITPDYANTTDTAAYPMPMVTYALVSTGPQQSSAGASELKNLLTNLVDYSHTAGANTGSPLPAGYIPLPDNLYQQALNDINTDIVGPGGTSPGGGSGGSGSANGSSAPGGAAGVAGANGAASAGAGTHGAQGSGSHSGSTGSGSSNPLAGAGRFVGHFIAVSIGDSRYFIPLLLALALLCLLGGPVLYNYPRLRRMAAHGSGDGDTDTDTDTDDRGSEGSPPPPDG